MGGEPVLVEKLCVKPGQDLPDKYHVFVDQNSFFEPKTARSGALWPAGQQFSAWILPMWTHPAR